MLGRDGRARMAAPAPHKTGPSANRIVLGVVLAFFGFILLYVVYAFGQYNGSYDRLTVSERYAELEVQIEKLQADNRQLRTQLAELDTIKVGHEREKAEVARTIGDLQAQVARESQQLAFYRGVVAKAPNELGVRLGDVRVTKSSRPGVYIVHIALLRQGRPDNLVNGTVTLHVDSDGGKVADLSDLTGGRLKEVPFNFQYYKNIDQQITLPEDFKPLHLGVDVLSRERDVAPLAQTYLWSVVTG